MMTRRHQHRALLRPRLADLEKLDGTAFQRLGEHAPLEVRVPAAIGHEFIEVALDIRNAYRKPNALAGFGKLVVEALLRPRFPAGRAGEGSRDDAICAHPLPRFAGIRTERRAAHTDETGLRQN